MKNKCLLIFIIFICFYSLISPSNVYAASKSLTVANYSQERSNWCWVTAGQIVAQYLRGTIYSQCTLYKAGKNTTTCVNEPGGFYDDMARVLKHGNVHVGIVGTALPPMFTIVEEIDKNKPIITRINWKSGGSVGHLLVIRGYDTNTGMVRFVYPKQSTSYTDKTSEYRILAWSELKINNEWETTHARYQLD
ncbi:papain-like cysteine protease family protein [Metasolibacillus meyeri]|uniref:Papain-like cysteine protease family protein n=1 Tax=Metasolibacillus meyeri TaxID=1071052 RepID=A0AAW9NXW1_9BACL|nr:papain-like cysteine protease family protein [Metasolibacillus meyeri]MEC1180406.1 papain-like cysteine protease family protein [Metasolibacillus meyeri]